ncbi:subunit sigma of RNA polymerase [Paenibacillus sp. 32O-W]|uniref:RNA polymerase subunit sigma n=2 Tax=Paenibacillus cisolokensis TaxID=1658519 RepID=A0ABQ4NEX4_9BACL|nr:sigma-70 family RNA polymerase sigma factor [Paenibacillus sp. 32O-W]ALS28192.1 subunit sigma of RNA polymerase [Paenibacillus sp. 32O-W]GIQ66528.1 RNA polymerase subunit sigma [Paenibacillus cisolokensis]
MARPAGPTDKTRFPAEPSLALERMMNEYGSSVLRTAYFYLGDRHLAEDISQEVFLRAYRNWTSFRGDSSVKTWLTAIAINACRDKLGLKMTREQPTDPVLMPGAALRSVEEEALERLDQTTILKYIVKLPAHYHEVIYLYYYLDLGTREIAEATGAPEGTVRGRLHRARELLSECLAKEGLA